MDRFEEWLREQGIEIIGQAATGSGDMVRFVLRLLDGAHLNVAMSVETLAYRPDEAIAQVETMLEARRHENGHAAQN